MKDFLTDEEMAVLEGSSAATGESPDFIPDSQESQYFNNESGEAVPAAAPTPHIQKDFQSRVNDVYKESGDNVYDQITGQGSYADQSIARRALGATATAFSTPLKVGYEMLPETKNFTFRSGISKLGESAGKIFQGGVENIVNVGEALANFPGVQSWVNKHGQTIDKVTKSAEEASGTLGSAGEIATDILAYNQAAGLGQKAADKIPAIAEKTKSVVKRTLGAEPDQVRASIQKDWEKPTVTTKPAYNKARDILTESRSKGLEPTKFLSEQGIDPSVNIQDGRYATADTADKLRSTAGKMSADTLRPALQTADYSTPRTPVSTIVERTIERIRASKGVTPGDIEAQISKARAEGAALQARFPDGMKLSDMHDYKITYASNGKYSPVGDLNVNNSAAVNRSFGNTLGTLVEDTAPPGVPVSDFNKYLQKYYNAADYLDALDTKTVPVSKTMKVVRGVSKGVGAAVGAKFGGLPTEFAGYVLGGSLEHAIESIPNPIKRIFLSNLKISNPAAYQRIVGYIGEAEAAKLTTPLLNAAPDLGSPGNPRPMGQYVPESTVTAVPATRTFPQTDSSGRLQTVYSSDPNYVKPKLNPLTQSKGSAISNGQNSNATQASTMNMKLPIGTNSITPSSVVKAHMSEIGGLMTDPTFKTMINNDLPGFFSNLKVDVVRALKEGGFAKEADAVMKIDVSKIPTVEKFGTTLNSSIKRAGNPLIPKK